MINDSRHFELSTYREHLAEHLFLADLLQAAWMRHQSPVEVMRSEVDMHGYDLVLGRGSVVRHVQLKASTIGAKAASQKVNANLVSKPAGCVVWVQMEERDEERRIGLSYLFFGGGPNEQLPLRKDHQVAKHTKANAAGVKAERPNIRKIPERDFDKVKDADHLLELLFGNLDGA